jgi:hypothetical protein
MSKPTLSPCGLFSSRKTLTEAVEYSSSLIDTLPPEHKAAAYTALWVSMNTALAEIAKLSPADTQPYPEDEAPRIGSIADLSPEETLRAIRTALPSHGLRIHALHKVSPKLSEPHGIFFALVCHLFGLSHEEISTEMMSLLDD